jgi:hypothetical protein
LLQTRELSADILEIDHADVLSRVANDSRFLWRMAVVASTKRSFGFLRLTMTPYGPAGDFPLGVNDMTRRRLSNQGKR